jgi:ABC-2 type transport system ATP-binding protein
MTASVVATDLHRHFGAVEALRGLSLQVQPGELLGLIGPDGAGKTTTLRILAGLLRPSSGTVRIGGEDPQARGSQVREILGYMPQRYSLYGDLSVGENLRFFGSLFCLDRETYRTRADRLLAITRLAPFIDRRAEALSGGMYKKLALACALLHQPAVLLLDEPTNGVDPVSRAELWDLLYEFVAEDMAVIVSTPYMDEAARCHRVLLIHEGRQILEGRPSDLVAGFREVVLKVDRPGPAVEAALAAAGAAVIGVAPWGGGLRVIVGHAASDALGTALRTAGASVEPVRAGFEDLFLAEMHDLAGHDDGR